MADSQLNIAINLVATGNGAQVTSAQITELSRAAAQGNAAAAASLSRLNAVQAVGTEQGQALAAGARELNAQMYAASAAADAEAAALGRLQVAGAAAAAAIAVAKAAVAAFAEKQDAVASLDAALRNNGELIESVRVQYQGLAEDLGKLSNLDDSEWLKALTTLTQFGADTSNIETYANAVKNLAGFIGGDLDSAAFVFGKAMQGNTEMLARYGIEVDKNASKTEQLNHIMDQLAARGGGQLEARTKTLSGGFAALKNATGNLLEGIGNLIDRTHALEIATTVVSGAINGLASLFPSVVEKTGSLENKLKDAAGGMEKLAETTETAQAKIKEGVDATNEALEVQIKKLLRIRALNDSLNDEQTGGKLAEVDAREARGELQPHQATAERARIKRESAQQKLGQEYFATRGTLDAANATRKGASTEADRAGGAADSAQAAFQEKYQQAGLKGSLKYEFAQASAAARDAKTPEQSDAAKQRMATIRELNALQAEAAAKEKVFQDAVQKEKSIFDSTAGAIQTASDALTVLDEKYKRLAQQGTAEKAKDTRVVFDQIAKFYQDTFGIEIKAGPASAPARAPTSPRAGSAPAAASPVISEAERTNQKRLAAEAAARPIDPAAKAVRDTMAREKTETQAGQQKEKTGRDAQDALDKANRDKQNQENRERWEREDKESIRRQRSGDGASAGAGAVDLSPLAVLEQSNEELNAALMATVQRMVASNQRTAADLRSQVRDNLT